MHIYQDNLRVSQEEKCIRIGPDAYLSDTFLRKKHSVMLTQHGFTLLNVLFSERKIHCMS